MQVTQLCGSVIYDSDCCALCLHKCERQVEHRVHLLAHVSEDTARKSAPHGCTLHQHSWRPSAQKAEEHVRIPVLIDFKLLEGLKLSLASERLDFCLFYIAQTVPPRRVLEVRVHSLREPCVHIEAARTPSLKLKLAAHNDGQERQAQVRGFMAHVFHSFKGDLKARGRVLEHFRLQLAGYELKAAGRRLLLLFTLLIRGR